MGLRLIERLFYFLESLLMKAWGETQKYKNGGGELFAGGSGEAIDRGSRIGDI